MKKIGVVFGGTSAEYEVSLKSTAGVLRSLEELAYEVVMIGVTQKGEWLLYQESIDLIEADTWHLEASCVPLQLDVTGRGFFDLTRNCFIQVDVIFPVLHGGDGENGVLQGVFELMKIPFVGCGVTASAIGMNKMMLHQFAESLGIKSTPSLLVTKGDVDNLAIQLFIETHGFPIFVKPNEAGSSKGITQATNKEELVTGITEAFLYDHQVILQKNVQGIEIGCSVLGNETLTIGACDQINLAQGFFDYEEKYQLITAEIQVPASLDFKTERQIKEQAEILYRGLGCRGLSRIDFFVTDTNEILLNEINTMPGFTSHSRFPMMMKEVGLDYTEIIQTLIELGVESYEHSLLALSE